MVKSLSILTAAALLLPAAARAATHYVAANGTASWADSTSVATPCSLETMLTSYAAGDVCVLRGGTYAPRADFSRSGTSGAHVTFQPHAGETATFPSGLRVSGSYLDFRGGSSDFEVTKGASGLGSRVGQVHVSGSHVLLQGFHIHGLTHTPDPSRYDSCITFANGTSYNTVESFVIDGAPGCAIMASDSWSSGGSHHTIRNGTVNGWRGYSALDLVGDYHTIESCVINGPTKDLRADGDGIRVNYSKGSVIKKTVIHNHWQTVPENQAHQDCIQLWVEVYDLLIDSCVLGTWQPGGLDSTPGPRQGMMVGTVANNSHVDFTLQNSLVLGKPQAGAAIILYNGSGSTLDARFYNNTFWSSYVSMNNASTVRMRNNLFRAFTIAAGKGGVDSDYNGFFWIADPPSQSQTVLPAGEGAHSLGKTEGTKLLTSVFAGFDVGATGSWGYNDGWLPAKGCAIVSAGIGPSADGDIPDHDFLGRPRSGATTAMGAYEYGPPLPDGGVRPDGGAAADASLPLAEASPGRVDSGGHDASPAGGDPSGCGCRLPGATGTGTAGSLLCLAVLIGVLTRRRRR